MLRITLFLMLFSAHLAVAQEIFKERTFATEQQTELFAELAAELRCLVCQNQNIADSNAELAQDLRREITTMIERGDNKKQIVDFMVQRYGEFVLYKPRFNLQTALLWLGPFLLFAAGIVFLFRFSSGSQKAAPQLDEQALAEARRLLDKNTDQS